MTEAKLHQLIAVEPDLAARSRKFREDTIKVFREKQNLFEGSIKTLTWFDEGEKTEYPDEHQHMTDTVADQLKFYADSEIPYLDAVCQKDSTNQMAVADLIVDGETITQKLPATFLLGLESKLVAMRELYAYIPTLKVGLEWKQSMDKGEGVFELVHPEETLRTAKKFKHQVLVGPTDKHPAQIEKWEEQVPVGKFTKLRWCSCFTSAKKAAILTKLDKLIMAVKQARQRANNTPIVDAHIGQKLFDYINS